MAALLCTSGRICAFPEMMAAEWRRSSLSWLCELELALPAVVLEVVNVNHTKCLFIRCCFFVFFGTACLRSPAMYVQGKNSRRGWRLRESSKMCWKAVIYVCCLFGLVWFSFYVTIFLLLVFLPFRSPKVGGVSGQGSVLISSSYSNSFYSVGKKCWAREGYRKLRQLVPSSWSRITTGCSQHPRASATLYHLFPKSVDILPLPFSPFTGN